MTKNTKAILILDMPKSCDECEYCGYAIIDSHEQEEYRYRSCALSKSYIGEIEKTSRYIGCPLRPMPQKISPMEIYRNVVRELGTSKNVDIPNEDFCDGWNYCLDEIMEETE